MTALPEPESGLDEGDSSPATSLTGILLLIGAFTLSAGTYIFFGGLLVEGTILFGFVGAFTAGCGLLLISITRLPGSVEPDDGGDAGAGAASDDAPGEVDQPASRAESWKPHFRTQIWHGARWKEAGHRASSALRRPARWSRARRPADVPDGDPRA
jgi:hypothetical protein